jgi:hypothetical protein
MSAGLSAELLAEVEQVATAVRRLLELVRTVHQRPQRQEEDDERDGRQAPAP